MEPKYSEIQVYLSTEMKRHRPWLIIGVVLVMASYVAASLFTLFMYDTHASGEYVIAEYIESFGPLLVLGSYGAGMVPGGLGFFFLGMYYALRCADSRVKELMDAKDDAPPVPRPINTPKRGKRGKPAEK